MKVAKRVVAMLLVVSLVFAMGVVARDTEGDVLCCTTSVEHSIGCCDYGHASHDDVFVWNGSLEELLEGLNSGSVVPSNVTAAITYIDECCSDCGYVGFESFFYPPKKTCHIWGNFFAWSQSGSVRHSSTSCGIAAHCVMPLERFRLCGLCTTRYTQSMTVLVHCGM